MRSGHLFWAKDRQRSEEIDSQALFDQYWGSNKHEFTLPSQSCLPTSPLISERRAEVVVIGKYRWSLELRFSANNTVRLLATAHPGSLTLFG